MEGGGAYGAAKAGGAFDPLRFVQQPQVLARIVSAVSAAGAALRCCVLRRAADARGIALSDDVIDFMLNRFSRDLSSLMALLDRLDGYALRAQRAITVPLLRAMLAAGE